MAEYVYKPLKVVAFQVGKDTMNIPQEFAGSLSFSVEYGVMLKNDKNTQVLKPIKEGYWVVKDVTKTPQIQIYSGFKFEQMFEIAKTKKK